LQVYDWQSIVNEHGPLVWQTCYRLVCLRYLTGLSYRQIARELDISANAAGVLLHRAKTRLRQALMVTQVTKDEVSR